MSIYIIGWIYFSLFLFMGKWNDRQKKYFFFIGAFAIIAYMYCFRETSVGTDTASYMKYFQLYRKYSLNELLFGNNWFKQMEPGFIIGIKAIQILAKDENTVLLCVGLIYAILFVSLLAKLESNERYWFAFAFYGLYIPCAGLNIMRQAFSVLLLLHAFLSFRKKKYVSMSIWMITACLIQYGSLLPTLIIIPFAFMNEDLKSSRKVQIIVIIGSIIGCFAFETLLKIFGLESYLSTDGQDVGLVTLMTLLFFIVIYNIIKKISMKYFAPNIMLVLETILLITFLMNIMGIYSNIFIRFTSFILPYSCFIVSSVSELKEISINNKRLMYLGVYIVMLISFFHNLLNNIGGIVPFVFV